MPLLEDYKYKKDEQVEKLAEMNYPMCEWVEEQCIVRRLAFMNGYNKAKETLYTKEQLVEVIELARLIDYNGSNDYYMSEDEIIKALKP